jgi:NADPH2:quinone reductase
VKALAYEKAHALDAFAITLAEVAEPRLRDGRSPCDRHQPG